MIFKIDLVLRDDTRSKRPAMSRAVALRITQAVLREARVKNAGEYELAVVLVGPKRIQFLNKKWRKIDKPTDVLAFPLSGPRPKSYTSVTLGDIVMCPTVVRAKAAETGLSMRAQMAWTLVHGLLHLLGHDHERSSSAAKKMASLEKKILTKLNVSH